MSLFNWIKMKKLFLSSSLLLILPFFCAQSFAAGPLIDRWATDEEVTAQTRNDVGITPSSISYLPAGGGGSNVTGPSAHQAGYSVIWGTANSTNLLEGYLITSAGKALVADGNITAQRATMEAAKSGVNTDITSMTGLDDDGIPGSKVVAANVTTEGVSERGTDAEAITGTDTTRHVTPANLVAREAGTNIDRGEFYDTSLQNIPDLASKGPAYNFLDDSNDNIATGQDLITGWGAFSVVALAKSTGLKDDAPATATLACNGIYNGGLFAEDPTTNTMDFRIYYDAANSTTLYEPFDSTTDQDWHTWVGTIETTGIDRDGYLYLYKDGTLVKNTSTNPIASMTSNGNTFNIGGDGASRSWGGEIARVLVFNIGLTEPWVKAFSCGISVPFKWNKNTTDKPGDTRNSGNFVTGAAYRILTRTDGNFTDAGAADNNVNTEFIATAVAAGVLDAGDTATRLGAVGIWEQDEIGKTIWTDRSGNNYDGTVSGATTVNVPIIADRTYVGLQDFSNAEVKLPNSGTLPAACAVGQTYMDTNATSGQRFYLCESTNVWALQGDGGAGNNTIIVKEDNVTIDVNADTLDYLGVDFDLTEDPENEVQIVIAPAIARDAEVAAGYQPLEATLTDIADGNITEDLENTKYPWADNEIADDLTIAKLQLDHNVETLAAGKTLGITDKVTQKLDPDGTDRDVLLPPEASNSTDLVFFIYNMGGEVGEDLNIQDDAAVDILSIGYLQFALCTCDGTTWIVRCLACAGAGDVVDLRAKEENTSAIVTGQPVYISGATGVAYPNVGLADCDDSSKIRAKGLASEDISQNSTGYIRAKGLLEDVNSTKGSAVNPLSQDWTTGDQLWVSATAGGLTNVRPIGRSIKAGTALTVEGSDSKILVYPRENPIYTGAASGEDIVRQMGDSAGANKISYTDFAGNEVAKVHSDGNATYNKVTVTKSVVLGASPTPGWKGDVNSTLQKTIDGHIYLAATDSGNGTVDIDLYTKILVNDILTTRMHLDADGNNYFPGADMNIENGKVYKINNTQIGLTNLGDIDLTGLADNSTLEYNATSSKWEIGTDAGSSGGETNTASSQGSGTSIYYQKAGVDLQFNAIESKTDDITVALNATSHNIGFTFNPGNVASTELSDTAANMYDAEWTAATTTAAGKSELATTTEVNTGTDTGRTITPDALAGSDLGTKDVCFNMVDSDTAVAVADGVIAYTIPACMNSMNLVNVVCSVEDKGVNATTDVQIRRRRAGTNKDMLGTKITIGDEWFATDESVNATNDDVNTGDQIYPDIDAIHSGTAPNGLSCVLEFRLP